VKVTATQRTKWLRRAETIHRKAEELFGDMLKVVGEEHPITDKADNVIVETQELANLLAKASLTMWKETPCPPSK
jgi:hypothetical protein